MEEQAEAITETAMETSFEETTEESIEMTSTEIPEAVMDDPAVMIENPAFFYVEFIDVNTGSTFKIDDFKGKVVLVETLAQWCSNCLRQQQQVLEFHNQLGQREDLLTLGLDIDPNEDADTLKDYVTRNGFTWLYAVSPVEVSREIGNLYGDQFLNPPSTPMFIIDRKGEVHLLPFGIKSADELLNAIKPFLEEPL